MTPRPESGQPIPPEAKKVFSGVLFDVYQWEQQLFDGSTTTFEKLRRQDTVVVIPVLENRNLLMITDEQPGRKPVTTFPGGRIEANEDAEEAARRELAEETGYEAATWALFKAIQPVSKLDWALYFFVARGCKKVSEPTPDAGEKITMQEVALDDALSLAHEPRFQSGELAIDFTKARYSQAERAKLERVLFGTYGEKTQA